MRRTCARHSYGLLPLLATAAIPANFAIAQDNPGDDADRSTVCAHLGSTSSSAAQWKQSGYEKFIVAARQWSNEPGSRTTMLLSPHPWPTNAGGKPDTFVEFTADTCSRDTRVFVERLREEHAIASAGEVDNYEGLYPHHAPAVAPENAPNATTEVGLRLAKHAPVDVHREDERNAICSPQAN